MNLTEPVLIRSQAEPEVYHRAQNPAPMAWDIDPATYTEDYPCVVVAAAWDSETWLMSYTILSVEELTRAYQLVATLSASALN